MAIEATHGRAYYGGEWRLYGGEGLWQVSVTAGRVSLLDEGVVRYGGRVV